jgi:hypothetical protein
MLEARNETCFPFFSFRPEDFTCPTILGGERPGVRSAIAPDIRMRCSQSRNTTKSVLFFFGLRSYGRKCNGQNFVERARDLQSAGSVAAREPAPTTGLEPQPPPGRGPRMSAASPAITGLRRHHHPAARRTTSASPACASARPCDAAPAGGLPRSPARPHPGSSRSTSWRATTPSRGCGPDRVAR